MINLLIIGDTHFKTDNIEQIDEFIEKTLTHIRNNSYDFIILLGDILHTHERLHTSPLNKAYDLIFGIKNLCPVFILVGNHDYINNQQFLTENHWMNALKRVDDICIVDKSTKFSYESFNFTLVPYVPNGSFLEALNSDNSLLTYKEDFVETTQDFNWEDSHLIFAHQEFKGCKMGAIISENGDIWDENYPIVISGHIHSKQKPQENIIYTGSALPVAFGESEDNTILEVIMEEDNVIYNEINLGLKQKKIIYLDVENIKTYDPEKNKDKILKICIKGSLDSFKTITKTKEYKNLIKKGIKIAFKPIKIDNKVDITNIDTSDFLKIVNENIQKMDDKYLKDFFTEILKT